MNIFILEDELTMNTFLLSKLKQKPKTIKISHENNSLDTNTFLFHLSNDILIFSPSNKKTSEQNLNIIQKVRIQAPQSILIVLSNQKSLDFMEACFHAGAHDFIQYPVHPREISAKISRWSNFLQTQTYYQKIEYEGLRYSVQEHEFYFKKQQLHLTKNNKKLLLLFLRSPESLLSSFYLQEKVWGDNYFCEKSRNIRSNIQLLRNSLHTDCSEWIQTIRGEGYMLKKVCPSN